MLTIIRFIGCQGWRCQKHLSHWHSPLKLPRRFNLGSTFWFSRLFFIVYLYCIIHKAHLRLGICNFHEADGYVLLLAVSGYSWCSLVHLVSSLSVVIVHDQQAWHYFVFCVVFRQIVTRFLCSLTRKEYASPLSLYIISLWVGWSQWCFFGNGKSNTNCKSSKMESAVD